jgi:hypothetical protein
MRGCRVRAGTSTDVLRRCLRRASWWRAAESGGVAVADANERNHHSLNQSFCLKVAQHFLRPKPQSDSNAIEPRLILLVWVATMFH